MLPSTIASAWVWVDVYLFASRRDRSACGAIESQYLKSISLINIKRMPVEYGVVTYDY